MTIASTKCRSRLVPKKAHESSPVRMTDALVAYPLSTESAYLSTAATISPPSAELTTARTAAPSKPYHSPRSMIAPSALVSHHR